MDPRNRFHTRTTWWIIRTEHLAVLAICGVLVVRHAGEVNWWRALAAFWLIDLVGYLPGAVAFRRSPGGRISRWYHHGYNFAHTYLVTGTAVAVWAWLNGGFEWAMLAVPIHLSIDRGVFGNTLKPAELSFEPKYHSDDIVLRALGRAADVHATATEQSAPDAPPLPRELLTDVLDHPSGYLALSRRNQIFTDAEIPGFISYRKQGKHVWLFGGVHARAADAGALLDRFLNFAAGMRCRVAAVQVRQSQVDLFASRGFAVNQIGSSYAASLADYSFAGGQKMQLRNKIKKARKLGLRVVELGKDVPRDAEWFARLEEVSARWLSLKGKKELDFMIGEIGTPEDHDRRIFLVLDAHDQPLAFITYVPVWGERPGYLHDLTRRVPDAPSGTMELCNAEAIERFQSEGVQYLHFGFTPFIIDTEAGQPASRVVHRLIGWLRKYGQKLYPAESQAAYKVKWGTDVIEREYVAARPLSFRAVFDLLLLTRTV